jgi:hypothetical protein
MPSHATYPKQHATSCRAPLSNQGEQLLRVSTADLRGLFPQQIPDRSLHHRHPNPVLPRLHYIFPLVQWQSSHSPYQRGSVFPLPSGPHDRHHNRSSFLYPAACLTGTVWLKLQAQWLIKTPATGKVSQDTKQPFSCIVSRP